MIPQPPVLDSIDDEWVEILVDTVILPAATTCMHLLRDDRNPPSKVYNHVALYIAPKLKKAINDYCNKQVVLGRIDENEAWLKLAQTTDADAVHLKSLIKQLEDHIKVLKAAQPHKGKEK